MISLVETRFALRGLLRILRFDSSFLKFYDLSRAGALRSFSLALPLLLVFLLDRYLDHSPMGWRPSISMITAYIINWLYFPLFLLLIGRFINREKNVIACVAVYNWLSLLTLFTSLPISLLGWLGMEHALLQVLDFVSLVISLVCEGYILAVCLRLPASFAAAFVLLDFILGQMLFGFAERLAACPLF